MNFGIAKKTDVVLKTKDNLGLDIFLFKFFINIRIQNFQYLRYIVGRSKKAIHSNFHSWINSIANRYDVFNTNQSFLSCQNNLNKTQQKYYTYGYEGGSNARAWRDNNFDAFFMDNEVTY